jgi:class 3 adenylate cyclase
VLVSRTVADATGDPDLAFEEIGGIELKGVSGTTNLLRARSA